MEDENPILVELKEIKRLLALSLVKEEPDNEKIKLLNKFGLPPKEISDLLNVNPVTVRTTLFRAGQVKKRKK